MFRRSLACPYWNLTLNKDTNTGIYTGGLIQGVNVAEQWEVTLVTMWGGPEFDQDSILWSMSSLWCIRYHFKFQLSRRIKEIVGAVSAEWWNKQGSVQLWFHTHPLLSPVDPRGISGKSCLSLPRLRATRNRWWWLLVVIQVGCATGLPWGMYLV